MKRRSLDETWRFLEADGVEMPRTADGRPFVPSRMPNDDDGDEEDAGSEALGFAFFKRGVEGADYSNLTLPRTFFGRSGFTTVDFRNTDLSESRMCWNDFTDCDFSGADLSGCDMRASEFDGCKFDGTSLRGADLRRSSFEACTFAGADMAGAVADDEAFDTLVESLAHEQHDAVIEADSGEEPPGG